MQMPSFCGNLTGFVSGEILVETTRPAAGNWREFLGAVLGIRGQIVLHDLKSSFFSDLADIRMVFSKGAPNETLVTGSIGPNHRFSGTGANGQWKVQLSFTGVQMERHLPSFWSLFPLSMTGAVQFRFPQPHPLSIRVDGILAFIPPLFPGRTGVVVRNRETIEAFFEDGSWHLHPFRLDVSGNEVQAGGTISPENLEIALQGDLNARKLQFLYPEHIHSAEGTMHLRAAVSGSPRMPSVDAFLQMGTARLDFGPNRIPLRLSNLNLQAVSGRIRVSFQLFGKEEAPPLSVAGGIRLLPDGPRFDGMTIEGIAPNEILMQLGTRFISDIQGRLRMKATANGPIKSPSISGSLTGRRLEFRVRGIAENISIQEADIRFDDSSFQLNRMKIRYADADFTLAGRIQRKPRPNFDLSIAGNAVPYNIPNIFQSEFNADLRFSGPLENTELSGKIDIISGRYIQTYDVIQRILTVHRFREREDPPWRFFPALGKTRLSISLLNTGELEVSNNVATLQLDGLLSLAGTLDHPRLQGQLTVNTGTFKVPFFRGIYDVDEGTVIFDEGEKPVLNIRGTTTVEDLNGDEILVRLHLQGPLNKIDFTLSSSPEMEQGQILMLLAAGRTMEDIRSAWRGNPRDGTGISSGGFNPLDYYDESIKQVTGDFLSMLVANPIKMVTRLDLFRLELGSDSFQVSAAKTFLKHITMKGEVEVGFLGRNRQEGGLKIKIFDNLWLEGMLQRTLPDYNQYEYEDPLKGRIELRYRMKFRGDPRDVMGIW